VKTLEHPTGHWKQRPVQSAKEDEGQEAGHEAEAEIPRKAKRKSVHFSQAGLRALAKEKGFERGQNLRS